MPAGFLIYKNLLPVPCNFVLWYCGGEVRIEYSLDKGGAARATPPESQTRTISRCCGLSTHAFGSIRFSIRLSGSDEPEPELVFVYEMSRCRMLPYYCRTSVRQQHTWHCPLEFERSTRFIHHAAYLSTASTTCGRFSPRTAWRQDRSCLKGTPMYDAAIELPRIPLLRRWMNSLKGGLSIAVRE
jgi:hypothetical protein